ncbi:MarR family transcriptional regulator [Herbiconiux sp. 11R-BC]|uniref:MarR family winged helix-turn-helix transcriptional regulator n=1 Tax=Herbiconiux sp. 11R-BC TaxID=3111637 RepID=UPI003C0ECCEE
MDSQQGDIDEQGQLDRSPLPDMYGQAGHWVRRAHQVHNSLWTTLVSAAVTPSQFSTLSALADHPNIDQNAISRATSLDTSTIGAIVNRLIQRGWIEVSKDPSDLRRNLLTLSPAGEDEFRLIAQKAARMTDVFVQPLAGPEQRELVRILKLLVEAGEQR